jgi:hypothetical protein
MAITPVSRFGQALAAEGLVPPHVRTVELLVPADGGMTLRYEVWVQEADLPKLGRALLQASAPRPIPSGYPRTRDEDLPSEPVA